MNPLLLATSAEWPTGEPGAEHLDAALAARGIESSWVRWDDPDVDWAQGPVLIRSTWDYTERVEEFLGWARAVPALLNPAAVLEWNVDKRYLLALEASGVPTVPTVVVDAPHGSSEADAGLAAAVAEVADPTAVVKPVVGAGGIGLVVATPGEPLADPGQGPWMVQPLVESIRTEGELSVFVFDGVAVSAFLKVPGADDIRAHEHRGATVRTVPVDEESHGAALAAVAAAADLIGHDIAYARVDMLRRSDGVLAVSELELVEPGLYLDADPVNAGHFADLVQRRV